MQRSNVGDSRKRGRILVPDRIIIANPPFYVSSFLRSSSASSRPATSSSTCLHIPDANWIVAHNGKRSRCDTSFEMRFRKLEIINRWKGLRGEGFRPCWATALLLKSEADYSGIHSGWGCAPPRAPPSEYRDYYALGLITIPNMNANWPPASSPPPRFPCIRVAVAGPRLFRVAY